MTVVIVATVVAIIFGALMWNLGLLQARAAFAFKCPRCKQNGKKRPGYMRQTNYARDMARPLYVYHCTKCAYSYTTEVKGLIPRSPTIRKPKKNPFHTTSQVKK